jgi:hypothetical protein
MILLLEIGYGYVELCIVSQGELQESEICISSVGHIFQFFVA